MAATDLAQRVFLVGFMGSGKSAVAEALAERLGYGFVDTDALVEAIEERSIERIFAENGESYFRQREYEVLRSLADRTQLVVATGGGLFQGSREREFIGNQGASIWLDAPLETIWRRCRTAGGRPLFGELPELTDLYEKRRAGYALADYRVEVGNRSVTEIVEDICRWLDLGSG
jgi:shikimate kinase